ncbi:hypothetical protein CH298_17855 [Rhodococcoides fascians]|uniref:5-methylcytosine restriction system specificity protein McrC n=1 Tax=Rhodococcoides fascians TaxID=1828 RepID=UPI000B9B6B57|nr:hypothetical protein [Rhodococcus fascians]OZE87221.1 hypothetical protein CH303_18210 [Rhodococcus fascians]OZF14096.1 hypothetical protein CH298_17855 [Rhodococcus fascians]OZF17582.1 hypothetical protein CH297_18240 [Rhodococcus fascians]OZF64172.1 hypothetical protein CH308_18130 [Rhodococcus fascians]OZF66736.1 hypothetical protein CH307_18335 [Rhodococcus fascians]
MTQHSWLDCRPVPDGDQDVARMLAAETGALDGALLFAGRTTREPDRLVSCQPDGRSWMVGRYVGRLGLGDDVVTIRPRVGQDVMREWLGFAPQSAWFSEHENGTEDSSTFIAELIGLLWNSEFRIAARHGLPARNISRYGTGVRVRGRIDVRGTVRHRKLRPDELAFSWQERSRDTVFGRAILAAFARLDHLIPGFAATIPHHLTAMLCQLRSEVHTRVTPTYAEILAARVTPATRGYRRFALFCLDVIDAVGRLDSSSGSNQSHSVLLDVAELWEHHVDRCLRAGLPHLDIENVNLTNPREHLLTDHEGKVRQQIRPDFIVREPLSNKVVAIVDAKYKPRMSKDLFEPADLYQLISYLDHFGGDGQLPGVLAFPVSDGSNESSDLADRRWSLRSGKSILMLPLDVSLEHGITAVQAAAPVFLA